MRNDRKPRCPKCLHRPKVGANWRCGQCSLAYDTFQTGARCPGCDHQERETECGLCHHWSAHAAWYRPVEWTVGRLAGVAAALVGGFILFRFAWHQIADAKTAGLILEGSAAKLLVFQLMMLVLGGGMLFGCLVKGTVDGKLEEVGLLGQGVRATAFGLGLFALLGGHLWTSLAISGGAMGLAIWATTPDEEAVAPRRQVLEPSRHAST